MNENANDSAAGAVGDERDEFVNQEAHIPFGIFEQMNYAPGPASGDLNPL